MPPSGYSARQVVPIREFLESCAQDLTREAELGGRSPMEALEKECADISRVVDAREYSEFASDVMRLTRTFYRRLLVAEPGDFAEFASTVPEVVDQLLAEMSAVHIPA